MYVYIYITTYMFTYALMFIFINIQIHTHRMYFKDTMCSKRRNIHEHIVKARILPMKKVSAVLASKTHYSDDANYYPGYKVEHKPGVA